MELKTAHIFPPCLCRNWRHWRQWFCIFSLCDLQIYPISVFILKFPLYHWIFSLSPLRFQNCFPASCVHREAWEGEWDGVEKWICIFICVEASADLRTVRVTSFLAVKPTQRLVSWLANWSDWLIHLTDELTYSHRLADPSIWALLLTDCVTSLADLTD